MAELIHELSLGYRHRRGAARGRFLRLLAVWRVLLPILPGPRDPKDRIAPFDRYFTDPFVLPLARLLRIHQRLVSAVLLFVVAAAQVGLGRLADHL